MEDFTLKLTEYLTRTKEIDTMDLARKNATVITDEGTVEKIGLTLNDYQVLSARTANDDGDEKSNYGLGITGEAGEVADLIKKDVHHGHGEDVDAIRKELGDVLWYVSQVARVYGLTLEEVAEKNVEKLAKRYPEGFSQEASVNREGDE